MGYAPYFNDWQIQSLIGKQNSKDKEFVAFPFASLHNPNTILIISLLFGGFGIDRMVIGDILLGVLKLLATWILAPVFVGFLIPLIDLFFIRNAAKEKNYNLISNMIDYA